MRIVRQRAPERFTVVDNDVIEDARISYRALGVLSFLLSRPDGWETNSERLAQSRPHEGRDAVRTALREIEAAGYLARRKMQDPRTGRWSTVIAVVDRPTPENPSSGPRRLENRPSADRTSVSQAPLPSTESNHGHKALPAVALDQQPPPRTPDQAREAEVEIPPEALDLLGDVHELASELRVCRQAEGHNAARWTGRAVRRAITAALAAGYSAEHIPAALMSIALDPATKTPGRLPHDGPWWDTAEIALRNRERARRLEERRRAEDAARRAREAAEVERRAACFTCSGTGRRSIDLGNRTITAICTHGSTEETA